MKELPRCVCGAYLTCSEDAADHMSCKENADAIEAQNKVSRFALLEAIAEEMAVALRHVDDRGLCQHVQEPLAKYESYRSQG